MRIKAYVLAADPAWIEHSVLSYYDIVDEIVVTYDQNFRGFTGVAIPVEECLERLMAIDRDKKMRLLGGDFCRDSEHEPMAREVYQRQTAMADIGDTADWILQIDTDEVVPNPSRLVSMLKYATDLGFTSIEWPMRLIFQNLPDGRFLEVCQTDGAGHFEYPGPIALRPGAQPAHGRRAHGSFLRATVSGDQQSLQISRPNEDGEERVEFCDPNDAIIHFSWARTPEQMRLKLSTWAHSAGIRSWLYYYLRWRTAPYVWQWHHDFHPFARGLWPALRIAEPFQLTAMPDATWQPDGMQRRGSRGHSDRPLARSKGDQHTAS